MLTLSSFTLLCNILINLALKNLISNVSGAFQLIKYCDHAITLYNFKMLLSKQPRDFYMYLFDNIKKKNTFMTLNPNKFPKYYILFFYTRI